MQAWMPHKEGRSCILNLRILCLLFGCVSWKLLLVSCIGPSAVSIPVPLDSVGGTEVVLVPLDEGGCYIWLVQCGGCTERNHSQPSFWKYLVSQIS